MARVRHCCQPLAHNQRLVPGMEPIPIGTNKVTGPADAAAEAAVVVAVGVIAVQAKKRAAWQHRPRRPASIHTLVKNGSMTLAALYRLTTPTVCNAMQTLSLTCRAVNVSRVSRDRAAIPIALAAMIATTAKTVQIATIERAVNRARPVSLPLQGLQMIQLSGRLHGRRSQWFQRRATQ